MRRDKLKTAYVEIHGIEVIRFENKLVFKDTEFVLNTIKNKFKGTTPHSPR
jgi:very-short-patch-repair endonuclease